MKKIYILFAVLVSFLVPIGVMAAVDVTINETTTGDDFSITISVDTGVETLESLVLPIQYSDDVIISDVLTGTVICNTFDYTDQNSILTITCELDSPTSLNGILANIDFTTTSDDYSFTVLENDPTLDVSGLEIGMVTNIGTAQVIMPTDDLMMEDEIDFPFEEQIEDDFVVTTQEGDFVEETTGGIMDFLPYILIGGSVVLLISIVAILLSKKGTPKKGDYTAVEDASTTSPSTPMHNENTLKDIVNNGTPMQDTPVPFQQPMQDTPTVSPTPVQGQDFSTLSTEEQDLQDILKHESTPVQTEVTPEASPMQPVNQTGFDQPQPIPQQPMMEPQTIEESTNTFTTSPEDMLSRDITQGLNEIQSNPQSVNEGINLQQATDTQPTTNTFNNQPTMGGNEQDENIPPVPPAM